MSNVWKYQLRFDEGEVERTIEIPIGAQVLHVDMEIDRDTLKRTISFWALVDPEGETEERVFHLVGTGHPVWDDESYYGTIVVQAGLVLHLFERGGKK